MKQTVGRVCCIPLRRWQMLSQSGQETQMQGSGAQNLETLLGGPLSFSWSDGLHEIGFPLVSRDI